MNDSALTLDAVLAENRRRLAQQEQDCYDPMIGVGCWGDRVEACGCFVPRAVLELSLIHI